MQWDPADRDGAVNKLLDWYAKRIADEVMFFSMQDDAISAQAAQQRAIAMAQDDSRDHSVARERAHEAAM